MVKAFFYPARNCRRQRDGRCEKVDGFSGDKGVRGAFFCRMLCMVILCALLPLCALAQDLDVLLEQMDYAVDDVSGMDTKDQGFDGVYIDPQTFARAFLGEESAQKMLSRLPLAQQDAAYYATLRGAELRTFERASGSYAAVTLAFGYDATSFFFARRYLDDRWECIGMFPMGDVTLEEDAQYGVWFSGTQTLHGTGTSGTQVYLYSPQRRAVVLSYTPRYSDYPLADRSMELIGSLLLEEDEIAVKHYLRGEGLWAGEATVIDFYVKEPDGAFRRTNRLISDTVDVVGTENRGISELRDL